MMHDGVCREHCLRIRAVTDEKLESRITSWRTTGQSCQVSVVFKAPSTSGYYNAELIVIDSSRSSVLTASLTGYAFPLPA
jgi:hypothetical protein